MAPRSKSVPADGKRCSKKKKETFTWDLDSGRMDCNGPKLLKGAQKATTFTYFLGRQAIKQLWPPTDATPHGLLERDGGGSCLNSLLEPLDSVPNSPPNSESVTGRTRRRHEGCTELPKVYNRGVSCKLKSGPPYESRTIP